MSRHIFSLKYIFYLLAAKKCIRLHIQHTSVP